METKTTQITSALMGAYLPLAGGTLTGDLAMAAETISFSDVVIKRDGAGVLGVYDLAELNYEDISVMDCIIAGSVKSANLYLTENSATSWKITTDGASGWTSLYLDDLRPFGDIQFQLSTVGISAHDADNSYGVIRARDNTVGLVEVARIVGAADPYVAFGGGQQFRFTESGDMTAEGSIWFQSDGENISAPNVDGNHLKFRARDTGVGLVEVGRISGAADAAFHLGGTYEFSFYNSGYMAFGGDIRAKVDNIALAANDADNDFLLFKARDNGVGLIEIARMVGAADPYFAFGGSQEIKLFESGYSQFDGDVYILDTHKLCAGTADDDYFAFHAKDSGVGLVEVARLVGAAVPYFAFGASQQIKLSNDGSAVFGSTAQFSGNITLDDGVDIHTGTTTGTKIGTATNNKIGFYNATPVVQQTGCAVPTDLNECINAITALRTALNNLGLTSVV